MVTFILRATSVACFLSAFFGLAQVAGAHDIRAGIETASAACPVDGEPKCLNSCPPSKPACKGKGVEGANGGVVVICQGCKDAAAVTNPT